VTFSDLESHFRCLKPFYLKYLGKYSVHHLQCLPVNRKADVACNFNYVFENKDFSRLQPVTYTVNMVFIIIIVVVYLLLRYQAAQTTETVQPDRAVATEH